ncbi:signal peptidase I [Paenibacillus durus]|uniref:signal peptidase I n=1 Tax=Paenibacillus durus TaxID=44251 RepID=UPI00046F3E79|nr:signal peptidase I [Paenibacillus durus]
MQVLFIIMMVLFSGSIQSSNYKFYIADGPSMAPTILAQDRITVDPTYYKEHKIERGDIIIFTTSVNESKYIKRVVGLAGDKVKISDNKLYVNDVLQDETYIQEEVSNNSQIGEKYNLDFPETKVPQNSIFVLGDNRRDSVDSRIMGAISVDKVLGKVIKIRPSSVR